MQVPECLNRRYLVLDDLIQELSETTSTTDEEYSSKLMCDFWNILKEDPECNLTQVIRQRMGLSRKSSRNLQPHRVTCYMANQQDNTKINPKHACDKTVKSSERSGAGRSCCSNSSLPQPSEKGGEMPLSKVLCNLKDVVSFDKKCNVRIGELLAVEKQLQDQIQHLEHREAEGAQMLKQAECMWACMEGAYKRKIQESLERQNMLLKQMDEVEKSNSKWRKNKKDLEYQCENMNKCYFEITEKINEKINDVKCIQREIENLEKRKESNKQGTEAAKKSFSSKKSASDAKIANLSKEIAKIQKLVNEEKYLKNEKDGEESGLLQEARKDLQKISKVILQKKLENEDLKAEKKEIAQEIEILNETYENCKDKCEEKQKTITDEITKIEEEIAGFKVQCTQCHQSSDTKDARKFCSDCPRCAKERECMYKDGHCVYDAAENCVCMSTKQKFLDNVFENMYTVLERQTNTPSGKAIAQDVLNYLKKSRNGKLDEETRKTLQNFVLTSVKKNLNLTIIGAAVKTRCEMDPGTYKQLMLCLKDVKTQQIPKADKGTDSKKECCRRWGGTNECNCPKGPQACICTKKTPIAPEDLKPCPPEANRDDAGVMLMCPKDSVACGIDCAMHADSVGTEVASWRPAPCNENHCKLKNMRAAQCVLGPESLLKVSSTRRHNIVGIPDAMMDLDENQCECGSAVMKTCSCSQDVKNQPRERIIEEVMGRYEDVTPVIDMNFPTSF